MTTRRKGRLRGTGGSGGSAVEATMVLHIRAANLPEPERELSFHPVRRWRFDFAWPGRKLALEVEGGTASGRSRHSQGAGFEADCEKYNAAALMGWTVLRVTSGMVRDGRALRVLERALERAVNVT
jgi:very-short-patch-repair endonuclease